MEEGKEPKLDERLSTGKPVGKEGSDDKKMKKRPNIEMFKIYIFKVLKQVHPDMAISSKAIPQSTSCSLTNLPSMSSSRVPRPSPTTWLKLFSSLIAMFCIW
ncbi:hypothetical protein PR202_ga23445 [Eleusine coracana subsp. coracana]|uniref:Uncharacterized protein n=1 Tax=Eleusine coracana subsp. coracana TaxID=191504 RepID=A0AAV5D699_ELECO|nr:hypothetical protein PR202_ga23445 [Eleusine coracana subsp. coracana]